MAIFLASKLWHKVETWTPARAQPGDTVTPGRVGTVFFAPARSLEVLADKPAGWGIKTGLGAFENLIPS